MFDLFGGGGSPGIQVRIGADISELQRSLDRVGRSFGQLGSRLTATVTAPLAAFGAAAVKFAIDAEETANKFDVVFGNAAESVRARFAELEDVIPLTTQQLEGLASGVQDLLVPLGLARDEAAQFSAQAVELSADIASFNNVAADVPLEALKSALAGQSRPLRQFGIDVSQSRLELLALEEGLIQQGQALNNTARAQAIFIAAQQDSSDAIGDAARTAGSAANQFRFLRRDVTQLAEDVGKQLIPIVAPLVERLRGLVNIFQDLSPQLQRSTIILAGLAAAAGPVLLVLAGISTALAAISAPVIAVAAGIGALTAAVIASGVSFSDIKSVAVSAWTTIRRIVQPIVDALQKLFQALRERVSELIEAFGPGLGQAAGQTFRVLQRVASVVVQNVASLLEALAAFIAGDFTGVLSALGTFFTNTFKGIADVVLLAVRTILQAGSSLANNLPFIGESISFGLQSAAAAANDIRPKFLDAGKNAGEGYAEGFSIGLQNLLSDVPSPSVDTPDAPGGGEAGRTVEVLDIQRVGGFGPNESGPFEVLTASALKAQGAFQEVKTSILEVQESLNIASEIGLEALGGLSQGFGQVVAQVLTFDSSIRSIGDAFRSLGRVVQRVLQQIIQKLVAAAIQAAILTAITGGAGSFGSTFTQVLGGGNPATGAARLAPAGGSLNLQQGSTIVLPSGDIQAAVRIGSQRTARGSVRGS